MTQLIVWLASKELLRSPLNSLVDLASIVFSVATILILYGLKFGVISQMTIGLLEDSEHRRITLIPNKPILESRIQMLENDERIGWIVPSQGSISQQYNFKLKGAKFYPAQSFPVTPSKNGDPLLPREVSGPKPDEILLGEGLAKLLKASVDDTVTVFVTRNSGAQKIERDVRVTAIVKFDGGLTQGAMLHYQLMESIGRWIEGYGVPEFDWSGREFEEEPYHYSVRMYARSLDDIDELVTDLNQIPGWSARKRTREISRLLSMDAVLKQIFGVFLFIVTAGFTIVFTASMCSRVLQGRRSYALLSAHGLPRKTARLLPILQSIFLSVTGFLLGLFVFVIVAHWLNNILQPVVAVFGLNQDICVLQGWHIVVFFLALIFLTTIASLITSLVGMYPNESESAQAVALH